MSDRIFVATRKGLFDVERSTAQTWKVTRASFLGDPVTMVLDDPRDGTIYAALNLGHFGVKLHRSEDRGETWTEIKAPAFPVEGSPSGAGAEGSPSDAEANADDKAPSVHQVWELAAGGDDQPGLLWAGTIPAAVFRSNDRGESWELNRPLWERPERQRWFGGGYDQPGLHSICVDPRDSKHLTVAISCGGVWVTGDRGETWTLMADGMRADYMPPDKQNDPTIQDPHRIVQCAANPDALWAQHHNGVFRTTNGAKQWSAVENIRPAGFGFAVAVHPEDAETAWFVPGVKDECRIPVDGKLVVSRTCDGGESFEVLSNGLPQKHAYDLVFRHALDIDRSGKRLAMGSTTGSLWISENGADSWQTVSTHLPPVYQVLFSHR